jgi:UbiD family decarboxylase
MDLHGLVMALQQSGRVLRVKKQVNPHFELAAVTRAIQSNVNLPVVFENVKGTLYQVISNVFGNYSLVAEMLGTDTSGVAAKWSEITRAGLGQRPTEGLSDDVPVSSEISMLDLPHITFCEKDAGPYLTASIVLASDPETKVVNLSYHRMQMVSENELRVRLSPAGDLFRIQQKAERAGKALEVAVLIGNPPALNIAGAASIAAGSSELKFAESLAGRRFPLRRCQTVDLQVPAHAEFVIEGEILANVRRPEGPFGEWQDYYVPVTDNHVLNIRHIAARENALFHTILSGSPEELALSGIPNAGLIYNGIRAFDPSVMDVVCFPWPQFCVIKLKKRYEGQARKAMLGAMGAETNRLLYCVVVDDDVNIHDLRDVLWAMSTRCRVDRDIFQIPDVPSFARDPHQLHWGRIGIDATAPLEWREEFERKLYPGLHKIRLDDYLTE